MTSDTPVIKSVSDFLEAVNQHHENLKDEQAIFYRGQPDASWKLEPSAYRNINIERYLDQEFRAYQEMLIASPEEFRNDKTSLEKIVRMQHYGLPTRILDVTANALVALYFACGSAKTKDNLDADGTVFIFKQALSNIYYPSSLPNETLFGTDLHFDLYKFVSEKIIDFPLLALETAQRHEGPSAFPFKDRDDPEKIQFTFDLFSQPTKKLSLFFQNYQAIENALYYFKTFDEFERILTSLYASRNPSLSPYIAKRNLSIRTLKIFKNFLQKNKDLFLISDINKINKARWIQIYLENLKRYANLYFVKSPLNNDRIRNQQGSFLLFGPLSPFFEESFDPSKNQTIQRITIIGNHKGDIRKELANVGITENFLFPDLAVQAKHIKNKIYEP